MIAGIVLAAALAAPSRAQTAPDRMTELEQKVDALSQELEQLRLSGVPAASSSAPAARSLTWGGYGELNGEFPSRKNQQGDPGGMGKTIDLRRFVLLGEYRFDERFSLYSEIEFEHASSGEGSETRGEVEVEQAYLDYRHADWLHARAGHMIVPLGLVNLKHEPTAFHGVERPSVEQFIIPSTWHENGAGLTGRAGLFEYQTYAFTGLRAAPSADPTVGGFTGASAIREGRTEGSLSPAEDLAFAGRLDARPWAGALVGASVYAGKADQGAIPASVPVSLWDAHASLEWRGLELSGLYAEGRIGNAGDVDNAQLAADPAFTDFAGSRFFGGYGTAAFNVLSLTKCAQYLAPFARYERYDTASRVPEGFAGNPATSRVEYTVGLTYRPIPRIALKADQQWKRDGARTGVNQWNFGAGWSF
jgi:hypothetical protein